MFRESNYRDAIQLWRLCSKANEFTSDGNRFKVQNKSLLIDPVRLFYKKVKIGNDVNIRRL